MNNPLHICHITTVHPSKDTRIFHKECVSLVNAGHKVTLLVGNGEDEELHGVSIKGVGVNYTGMMGRFLKSGKALYRAAVREGADVYHFHDPEFLRYAVQLQRSGAKVIYDVHEDLPRQVLHKHYLSKPLANLISFLVERYENKISSKLDAILTATDHITDRFKTVNPSTYSVKNYPILDPNLKLRPFSEKKPQACHIGALTKERGINELVMAMEKSEFKLQLAGQFFPAEMEEEISRTEGWNNIIYHGFVDRDKVNDILSECMVGTVTLHPIINYLDALPVKLFEYMAAGIPVISSNIPLWKGIIEEAGCGVAVDPYDPEAISRAMNEILSDPEKAEEMGRNGREAVEREFNWTAEEEVLLEVYSQLSAHKKD